VPWEGEGSRYKFYKKNLAKILDITLATSR